MRNAGNWRAGLCGVDILKFDHCIIDQSRIIVIPESSPSLLSRLSCSVCIKRIPSAILPTIYSYHFRNSQKWLRSIAQNHWTPIRQTTLFVPSIHCASCTSFVETVLSGLDPSPKFIETSIVNQSVTVHHSRELRVSTIALALADGGYRVDSAVSEPPEDEEPFASVGSPDDNFPLGWITNTATGLSQGSTVGKDSGHIRHEDTCMECRDKSASESSPPRGEKSFVAVDSLTSARSYFEAVFSVEGMSCSSCVGKITAAIEGKPWVMAVNVSLLTRIATIQLYDETKTSEVVKIINTLGYDTSLEETQEVQLVTAGVESALAPSKWKATLTIDGMTCSSCVGTITKRLQKIPGVDNIDVNLLTGSASLVINDKNHIGDILDTIEGIGYKAALDDLVDLAQSHHISSQRTILVRIDGMHCQRCPSRVVDAVKAFDAEISIDKVPTIETPIMTLSYTPKPPGFTIRQINSAITAVDPAFRVAIYHPPTVEERARVMQAKSRNRLLYRILLTLAASIPALIIGIVYMNLVPMTDPNAHYLIEPLKGVSRAEWALLVLATPVYFFAADVFHRRAIKELVSLWRPGSFVPLLRRFYKFGSMDMLIFFATTIAYFSSITEIIIAATLPPGQHMEAKGSHLDAVIFLTLFLLAGRLIEAYSKAKTGEAVSKLGSLRPNDALLLVKGDHGDIKTTKTSIGMLESGDLVKVVHSASPPWDGIVIEGTAEFVESGLTGESKPVPKHLGDPVYSGTVNHGGPITIRLTGAGGESLLDQIIKVVREGQLRRAPIERVADAITGYFVPFVTLVAIATWLVWLSLGRSGRLPNDYLDVSIGGWPFWSLQFAIAVFVITCPCGIGLAAPTALFVGGGLAAKYGILVKGGGEAFQEASSLDIIVFDKTGTLTEGGEPKITNYKPVIPTGTDWDEQVVLGCLSQ